MKDSPSQVALRQWRAQFTNPVTLLILTALATLSTILAPFDTGVRLTPAPRFLYWLLIMVVTYSVSLLIRTWLQDTLPPATRLPVQVIVVAFARVLALTPIVVAINYATFAFVPSAWGWFTLSLKFFIVGMIVSVIIMAVKKIWSVVFPPATPVQTSALLDRLPLDKRGPLVSLSCEDHATRIRTTHGEDLILIPLSDAIREAAPVSGLRVHRSHWVALDQVARALHDGDSAVLTMTKGGDIPVSRANVKAIKDAGLLPQ